MPKRHYEVDPRVLTVFFFVAIPFLAFGALVIMNLARGQLQNVTGQNLEQRARRGPAARRALRARPVQPPAPARPRPAGAGGGERRRPATERPDELRRLDQAWAAGDPALVASVAGSPLAARLREMGQIQPALRLLQVVDERGRLLATTTRGGRLWNGETAWFRALGGDGDRRAALRRRHRGAAGRRGRHVRDRHPDPRRHGRPPRSEPCARCTTRPTSTACSPPCASARPDTPS